MKNSSAVSRVQDAEKARVSDVLARLDGQQTDSRELSTSIYSLTSHVDRQHDRHTKRTTDILKEVRSLALCVGLLQQESAHHDELLPTHMADAIRHPTVPLLWRGLTEGTRKTAAVNLRLTHRASPVETPADRGAGIVVDTSFVAPKQLFWLPLHAGAPRPRTTPTR